MNVIEKLRKKKVKLVAGLMSGTSADGIDAALVQITGSGTGTQLKLVSHVLHPFPNGFRQYLLANSLPGSSNVGEIARLDSLIGEFFADAVNALARKAGIPMSRIDLIGSHGQTVHHLPKPQRMYGKNVRATLQIGDPSVIAVRTSVPTVGDFRTADVAAGGQGAPLVPYLDFILFRSSSKNRVALNVGGIANITILPKGCALADVMAFDTGPGNMLIDAYCKQVLGVERDEWGAMAAQGEIRFDLLKRLMPHPFLKRRPPKTTGREEFGEQYLNHILHTPNRIPTIDVLATLTEFTALSIYDASTKLLPRGFTVDEVIASGGGIHNSTLMRSLAIKLSPARLLTSDALGIPSDAKEAMLMALLANEAVHERAANLPRATGAKKPVVLGKICL